MSGYLSSLIWTELLERLATDDELRQSMGVKLCPFSGQVEEYTMVDQLGGMLNIWPEKWRRMIEADLARVA